MPPNLENACLTSETVLFLLSDIASTKIATPPGPYPSNTISSSAPVSPVPEPFSIALLILSLGIFAAFALSKASLNLGLSSGSGPPFAATVISLITLVQIFPLDASCRAFLCLMFAHLECPAIYLFFLVSTDNF